MPFVAGQPKTPGSGRKRGVPDKRTRIAREGAKTAIELLSRKGLDPISVQQELIQVMRDVADVILGRDKPDAPPLAERISNLPPGRLELALKAIDMACQAQSRLTAFRYPKLQQVTVNDAMADQTGAAEMEYFRRIIVRPGDIVSGREPVVIDASYPLGTAGGN